MLFSSTVPSLMSVKLIEQASGNAEVAIADFARELNRRCESVSPFRGYRDIVVTCYDRLRIVVEIARGGETFVSERRISILLCRAACSYGHDCVVAVQTLVRELFAGCVPKRVELASSVGLFGGRFRRWRKDVSIWWSDDVMVKLRGHRGEIRCSFFLRRQERHKQSKGCRGRCHVCSRRCASSVFCWGSGF